MTRPRWLAALAVMALVAAGCGSGGDGDGNEARAESPPPTTEPATTTAGETTSTTEPADTPPPPGTNAGTSGSLGLGRSVHAVRTSVGAGGGTVEIARGTLEGLAIDVPAGAYEDTTVFDITLTSITSDTYGDAVMALSPLITVDNGGDYSADLMTVTVPAKVPTGMFAMGFLYEDGRLEALPLVDITPDHVTVATRHFSSFFIAAIAYALLPDDVATGYRVQEDNWQFVNRGTYPKPNGICTGMSLTSIWYFLERKATDGELWERWDNDGARDTPGFWYDDAWALRWATKVHSLMEWSANVRHLAWTQRGNERLQYDAFRYAMYITGEPQLLEMWDVNGANGHAMVVYAQTGDSLWVADPNYPKDLRQLRFDDESDSFMTYSSGANAETITAGEDVAYEEFILTAKSSIFDWPAIGALYEQMQAGVVGAGLFPPYTFEVRTQLDDGSTFVEPLQSGYLTSLPVLKLGVNPTFDTTVYLYEGSATTAWGKFNANARPTFVSVPLALGANHLSIGLMGGPNSAAPNKWVDFRHLTIYREEGVTTTLPPATAPPVTAPPTTAPPQVWDCTGLTGLALLECQLHNEPISQAP